MENSNVPAPDEKSGPALAATTYWRRNILRLSLLLGIWFVGSFGVSILFVDFLDQFSFFGFPVGFWFAQQGSILLFLVLIVAYVVTMNSLDDEYERNGSERRGDGSEARVE